MLRDSREQEGWCHRARWLTRSRTPMGTWTLPLSKSSAVAGGAGCGRDLGGGGEGGRVRTPSPADPLGAGVLGTTPRLWSVTPSQQQLLCLPPPGPPPSIVSTWSRGRSLPYLSFV